MDSDTPNHSAPSRTGEEISGDGKLSLGQRWRYLVRNFIRNVRAPGAKNLELRAFCLSDDETRDLTTVISSPSRALTDVFLSRELPSLLPHAEISVLDIGCGAGRLSDALAAQGLHGTYTGIDVDDRFRTDVAYPDAFERRFVQDSIHNHVGDGAYDLIVSVSALEHINDDAALISRLGGMLSNEGLGVHFVPAGWGLLVYLWHGYRQYTIGDIETKFGSNNVKLYGLGGGASLMVHFIFITLGEMLLRLPVRHKFGGFYNRMLRGSLWIDRFMPYPPTMFVVCHGPSKTKTSAP